MQMGLSAAKWFTEFLTLEFPNAKYFVRSWDTMPPTGILFAIYACCLGLWKTP